ERGACPQEDSQWVFFSRRGRPQRRRDQETVSQGATFRSSQDGWLAAGARPCGRLPRDGRFRLRVDKRNAGNGARGGDGRGSTGGSPRRGGGARGGGRPREWPAARRRRSQGLRHGLAVGGRASGEIETRLSSD